MTAAAIKALAPSVSATLLRILEAQNDIEAAAVLRAAAPTIEYLRSDGWNDETDFYELALAIPAELFARIERGLPKVAQRIENKLIHLRVGGGSESLSSVRIYPQLLAAFAGGASAAPSVADVSRLWGKGGLRLFLSHVSKHKVAVASLKKALAPLGVSAFVAHEDIEPTLEWQREIETALQSMDALCALLTPEFHPSNWTDQEVGIALGRNVPVIAVRLGADPYGFIGKRQAIAGDLANAEDLAAAIFEAILRMESLRTRALDHLVHALRSAMSYSDAKLAMRKIGRYQNLLSRSQVETLVEAKSVNHQVRDAFGVPEQIQAIAKKIGVPLPRSTQVDSGFEEDIPF